MPDSEKNEWIPKDIVSLQMHDKQGNDYFIHIKSDELQDLKKSMEKGLREEQESILFGHQKVPVNRESLDKVKRTIENFKEIIEKLKPDSNSNSEPISRIVPIIRDNLDVLKYEREALKKLQINTSFPLEMINTKQIYEHQKCGIQWLQQSFLKRKPGVILADDMGLGKTLQVLVFFKLVKKSV